jgi:hypothetical protein
MKCKILQQLKEQKNQVVHEEYNAPNESIGEDDVLSRQEINHQILTDLKEMSSHPLFCVISDPTESVKTRSVMNKMIVHCTFVSQFELKNFKDVNNDSHWICAMQDELNQFKKNQV